MSKPQASDFWPSLCPGCNERTDGQCECRQCEACETEWIEVTWSSWEVDKIVLHCPGCITKEVYCDSCDTHLSQRKPQE